MTDNKFSKFIPGILAFGIYFMIIGALLFYFNTRNETKSVHYVKKNEQRIQVSSRSATKSATSKPKTDSKIKTKTEKVLKPKVKPEPKVKPKVEPKPEKVVKPKVEPKVVREAEVKPKPVAKPKVKPKPKPEPKVEPKPEKVVKPKVEPKPEKKVVKEVVKKEDVNLTKPKKVDKPKDLFANVSSTKSPAKKTPVKTEDKPKIAEPVKNVIEVSEKPSASDLLSDSLKIQKNSDSGVENAYFSKIEEKLKGWPAQGNYAGETAKVSFVVQPDGSFVFNVTTASGNEEFNSGLIAYLKQLQSFGFGRHEGNRAYDIEVEFVATE